MKITFILSAYPWRPNGGFRTVYEHANQLAARGHDVTIIHPRRLCNWPPPPTRKWYRGLRWKARRAGALVRDCLFTPRLTWQPVDRRVDLRYVPEPTAAHVPDADVVFATYWPTAEYVVEYPPQKGERHYLVQDFGPFFGPEERVRATWKMPFHRVAISKWLCDEVRQAIGAGQTVWVPEGIDHRRFHVLRDITTRLKCLAMCFSTAPYKAPWDAVRAAEICKAKHPDIRATLFGPGPRPARLPSWMQYRQNVPERELVGIYNQASVFVCSSLAEGFAFPPAEAMACGCAVAATDCGGIRDYAEPEVTALLSSPGNPEALARNILRLLEDGGLRLRLARAGQERIREFSWERSADALEGFLKTCVQDEQTQQAGACAADRGA